MIGGDTRLVPLRRYWILSLFLVSFSSFIERANCEDRNCTDHVIPLSDVQTAVQASWAVYETTIKIDDHIGNTGFKVTRIFKNIYRPNVEEGKVDVKDIAFLVAKKDSTSVIAFRGELGGIESLKNFTAKLINVIYPDRNETLHYKLSNGTIMKEQVGVLDLFWNAMLQLKEEIKGDLVDPHRKYIVTGHGMGGAIASHLSIVMKSKESTMWNDVGSCLITFGEPHVGGENYARLHDKMISPYRKLRFIFNDDIIPNVPVRLHFRHHSREIFIKKVVNEWPPHLTRNIKWNFCKGGDPLGGCSEKTSFPLYLHVIDNYHEHFDYKDIIMNGTNMFTFYTENGRFKESWEDAWKGSCTLE